MFSTSETTPMVFASPPRQFYRDGTPRNRPPGLRHLDNFAGTRKLASIYRDFAKTTPLADIDGNFTAERLTVSETG